MYNFSVNCGFPTSNLDHRTFELILLFFQFPPKLWKIGEIINKSKNAEVISLSSCAMKKLGIAYK